jgi:hypothetical protein
VTVPVFFRDGVAAQELVLPFMLRQALGEDHVLPVYL